MKEKVLVSDDPGDIHYIDEPFLKATHSLCGERLHSISTVRMNDKHAVSCAECLRIVVFKNTVKEQMIIKVAIVLEKEGIFDACGRPKRDMRYCRKLAEEIINSIEEELLEITEQHDK